MFFWNSLAFLMIQWMLAIWFLVSLPFLKSAWTSGSSRFTHCCGLAWRILSITFLLWEMSAVVQQFEHSLALPFSVLQPLLSFPNLLAYWVQPFHSIIYRMWNSSTGIPSPPLALFVVMVSKAHLTSHSRMSGSRWVITPSWLSESWRPIFV